MAAKTAEVDLSEFEVLSQPRRAQCSIAVAFQTLDDPEEQEKLGAALAAPGITHAAINRWLQARGIKIAEQTIGRHRDGRCSCDA